MRLVDRRLAIVCNYTGIPLKVIGRRKLEKIRRFSRVAQSNDVGSFDPIILSYSIIHHPVIQYNTSSCHTV